MVEGFAEGIDNGNPVEAGFVVGWLDGDAEIEGLALGNVRRQWDWSCRRLYELDDGTPVEMGFVLGWLDGNAEIEGLTLGNVHRQWDWSCRRLYELEEVCDLLLWERLLRLMMMPLLNAAVGMHKDDWRLLMGESEQQIPNAATRRLPADPCGIGSMECQHPW